MQVQRAQLPQQLRVAVPERWNHRDRQPVGAAQPVDPAVQFQPLGLRFLAGQPGPAGVTLGRTAQSGDHRRFVVRSP